MELNDLQVIDLKQTLQDALNAMLPGAYECFKSDVENHINEWIKLLERSAN